MKRYITSLITLGILVLIGCSTAYHTGQTPDDVYYSPGRAVAGTDEYSYTNPDDNYLRMKVQDRTRWNTIDDANYWYSYNRPYSNMYFYDPIRYSMNNWNTFGWNPYGMNTFGGYPFWNTYNYGYPGYYSHGYNGGYFPGTVVIRQLRSNTGPKPYMGSYNNNNFNNANFPRSGNNGNGRFINTSTGNNNGASYNNQYDRPTRTFTPSSATSPSSSSSSSSGSSRSTGSSTGTGRSGRGGN